MTKYGIKHKVTGQHFLGRVDGKDIYLNYPSFEDGDYYEFMTEAILAIITLNGESFLEVFIHNEY